MKKLYKKILLTVVSFIVISIAANAQTNVSGGIYSNTTWTLANSPYIVTDTVVVFPGVTLTIQPGVTVKFADGKYLEIRQAKLFAIGTISDSITFTSNSATPIPGIWNKIYLNGGGYGPSSSFNYCKFHYANYGICGLNSGDSLHVKNSLFKHNNYGIYAESWALLGSTIDSSSFIQNLAWGVYMWWNVKINHCYFSNNQNGCYFWEDSEIDNCNIQNNSGNGVFYDGMHDKVQFNQILNNSIGIKIGNGGNSVVKGNIVQNNDIGINLFSFFDSIYCNLISNNSSWDLKYNVQGNSTYIAHNDWGIPDSLTIESHIYDGYDNINLGLVNFMPFDTTQCYLNGCNLLLTTNVTNASCDTCHNGSATVNVANGVSPFTYTWYTTPLQTTQTATGMAPGTYTVCVVDHNGCSTCNYHVVIDSNNCNGLSIIPYGVNTTCSTCNDGIGKVQVLGGSPPYSYTWYTVPMQNTDSAINLLPGIYGVCVTDHYGCAVCDSVSISTGSCSAHFNLYPDSIQIHQYYAVNMASGVSPISYLWNWGDGNTDTGPYPTHTYATAGYYAVCLDITDAVGCTNHFCNSYYLQKSTNAMVTINVIPQGQVGTSEYSLSTLQIYPNPASNTIYIKGISTTGKAEIFNISGKLLLSKQLTTNQIDISPLAKGLYFIKLSTADGSVVRKFVKE